MIRPVTCLVSQWVVRDGDTNNLSVFNILEGVTAQGFPFFIQHVAFLVIWERDAEDISRPSVQIRIELEGNQLYEQSLDADFQDKLKNRMVIRIGGLVVSQPGKLTFSASPSTGASAKYTINVIATESAIGTTTQSTA